MQDCHIDLIIAKIKKQQQDNKQFDQIQLEIPIYEIPEKELEAKSKEFKRVIVIDL
jgi:hypothetical protein